MGFQLGQILPVKLPVSVQVTNNRLACLQLCLQLVVVRLHLGQAVETQTQTHQVLHKTGTWLSCCSSPSSDPSSRGIWSF